SRITDHASPLQNPKSKIENPNFFHQVWAIVAKDIAAELHTREIFSAMFVFAVLALLIFSFALDLRGALAQAAAPGVLWATIAFAGTLGLSRSMAREQQTGGIEGLLLAPVDRAAIFFGKALGNLALMLAVELVLVPLAMVMFDVAFLRGGVLLTLLLGTVAYAAVGTLLAAIAVNTRAREVMLPILLLPLLTPLLIAAVKATSALIEGAAWAEIGGWGQILVVYNLLIIAVSLLTFGYVVEE
ncbi:MAG: heme exporter protein CcmB, partial [Anaerolineae bacterium]|nr:heme exporter protein CcmB [Anaerolineae bacterium]